ncbi:hypothetical protein FPQ18DRAFT_163753 [Pyronema domesticum]|nr:hypothetical protein FPQ18DRAFT_163753 [Pyronema domesticum]
MTNDDYEITKITIPTMFTNFLFLSFLFLVFLFFFLFFFFLFSKRRMDKTSKHHSLHSRFSFVIQQHTFGTGVDLHLSSLVIGGTDVGNYLIRNTTYLLTYQVSEEQPGRICSVFFCFSYIFFSLWFIGCFFWSI